MNFQSVRPSISTLLLFSSLIPALSLSFMAYSCAATQALAEGWLVGGGGMGDGWFARFQANWNIHVCVPVSLCESAFTCTPPRSLYTYMCLFMSVVWSGRLLGQRSACLYWPATFVHERARAAFFCQVMRKVLSFDLTPKIRLCTSITHELLCTRSHDRPRRRN